MRDPSTTHPILRTWPVLLLAFMLLAGGVRRDLPLIMEVDEPTFVGGAVEAVTGRPDPDWYGHPGSTFFYTLGVVLLGDRLFSGHQETLTARFDAGDPTLVLYGRLVNVWFGLLAAAVMMRLARRVYPGRSAAVGRYAALLLAATPLVIDQITLARTDGFTIFFAALLLCVLIELWFVGFALTTRNMTMAGAIVGLAVATKYQLGIFLLPAVGIVLWRGWRRRIGIRALVTPLLILGGVSLLAFTVAAPFVLIDWREALRQLLFESRSVHPGADGLNPLQNLAWYLTDALPRTLGPLLLFLGIGIAAALRKRSRATPIFPVAALFLLATAFHPLHWQRWLLPIMPALVILTAGGIQKTRAWLAAQLRHRWSWLNHWPVLLLALTAAWGGFRAWQLSRPGTRVAARAWLLAETERPLRVAYEEYSVDNLDGPRIGYIRAFSLAQTSYETPEALAERGMDYAVISDEIYGRFEPGQVGADAYAKEWAFYQALFDEEALIAEFEPRWNRPGPLIRIYRLREAAP